MNLKAKKISFKIAKFGKSVKNRIRYTLRRHGKAYAVLICIFAALGTFYLFLFQMNDNFKKRRAYMEEEFYNYINEKVEKCLKYKNKRQMSAKFEDIGYNPRLKLQPVKMNTNTAVFLIKSSVWPYTVLKRTIINKETPIYEDVIALKLNHKNIVKSHKSERRNYISNGVEKEILWLYMEYLNTRISYRFVNKDEETIRLIMHDLLQGLKYLHERNIAHLDLKIANIMGLGTGKRQTYKIIDFGYARKIEPDSRGNVELKIPNKNYGTYPYKPPEIVFENIHGIKSDIWCVGMIAWFLSLGKPQFYLDRDKKDTATWKSFLRGDLNLYFERETSFELRSFIRSCLKIDRNARPSASELLEHKFIRGESDAFFF